MRRNCIWHSNAAWFKLNEDIQFWFNLGPVADSQLQERLHSVSPMAAYKRAMVVCAVGKASQVPLCKRGGKVM